ncbi:hypothetical protein Vretifemale_11798 [Volvox reticuliferus]|uniref:Uncharacterized protein n=1 Tax=Volvox reticuliferus TaxID=1737510 RepID=A0A8J4CMN0_9CHLO|nr:hypothetical protein Vretifemale_11798 [Volvox reticuliferus]
MLSEQAVAIYDCGYHHALRRRSAPRTQYALGTPLPTSQSSESGTKPVRSSYPNLQPIHQPRLGILHQPFSLLANSAFQDAVTSLGSSALEFHSTPDNSFFSSAPACSRLQVIFPYSLYPRTSPTCSLDYAPIDPMLRAVANLGLPKLLPQTDADAGSILSPRCASANLMRWGTLQAAERGLLPLKAATLEGQIALNVRSASQLHREEYQHQQCLAREVPAAPRDVEVAAATISHTAAAVFGVTNVAAVSKATVPTMAALVTPTVTEEDTMNAFAATLKDRAKVLTAPTASGDDICVATAVTATASVLSAAAVIDTHAYVGATAGGGGSGVMPAGIMERDAEHVGGLSIAEFQSAQTFQGQEVETQNQQEQEQHRTWQEQSLDKSMGLWPAVRPHIPRAIPPADAGVHWGPQQIRYGNKPAGPWQAVNCPEPAPATSVTPTTRAAGSNVPVATTLGATAGGGSGDGGIGNGCSCGCGNAISSTSKSDWNVNHGAHPFPSRDDTFEGKPASKGFERPPERPVPVSVANTAACLMNIASEESGGASGSCNTFRTVHAMSGYVLSSVISRSYKITRSGSGGYNGPGGISSISSSLNEAECAPCNKPSGALYDDPCEYDSTISISPNSSLASDTRSAYMRAFLAGRGGSRTHWGSPRPSHIAVVDGAIADEPYIRPPLPNPFAALLTQSAVVLEIGGLWASSAALGPGLPAPSGMMTSANGLLVRTTGGSGGGSRSRRASLASVSIGRVLRARFRAVAAVAAVTASVVLSAASLSSSSLLAATEPRQDDSSAVRRSRRSSSGDGQDYLDLVDTVIPRLSGLATVAAEDVGYIC